MADRLPFGTVIAPTSRSVLQPRPDVALACVGRGLAPSYESDEIAVVLDGAIYNHDDSDVGESPAWRFAQLYRKHGFQGALSRINGDFAVALHDSKDGALWLARDRIGIKPLYYAAAPHLFAFASRPRPLLGLPGVGGGINVRFAAVFAGAHYRYIDNRPEESPYEKVSQALAGHWYCLRNGALTSGRYWNLEDAPDYDLPEAELAERYRELLLDAVEIRARQARQPAFTLSGGMDSSSVLVGAGQQQGWPQTAYSAVYTDATFDESKDIKPMLEGGRVTWNAVVVDDPDVFEIVDRMVAVHDEPVATATWLSHFLLCDHVARGGYNVLFGGLGGDELNAGEYEYFFYHFADLKQQNLYRELDHEIERWAAYHNHPIWRKDAAVAQSTMARLTDETVPGRVIADTARLQRYYPAVNRDFFDLRDFVPIMESPFRSYLKTRTYQDMTRETTPCCLRAEDRHGAAFGLENALPFLDHRLIEFMFRVPGGMKIRDGVTKHLLRRAMSGILPEETRTRIKKTGWNAPAHLWFGGAALDRLMDLVRSRAFRERGVYNVAAIEGIIAEHRNIVTSGTVRENHMMFLWQLLNLETWLRQASAMS